MALKEIEQFRRGKLIHGHFILMLLSFTALITGCIAPNKYTPTVAAGPVQHFEPSDAHTIPTTVRIVKLLDVSPREDKEDGGLYGSGWSVTSPERLNGDLAELLTVAIPDNLKANGVFTDVVQEGQEDVRIEGKIHKFYQRREQYLWSLCCGLLGALLPFPLMKEEGEADIELTLIQANGSPLKSYRGKSQFLKRCNFYENRCWESYNTSPAKYLDEAFGESMYQIRQSLLRDKILFVPHTSRLGQ